MADVRLRENVPERKMGDHIHGVLTGIYVDAVEIESFRNGKQVKRDIFVDYTWTHYLFLDYQASTSWKWYISKDSSVSHYIDIWFFAFAINNWISTFYDICKSVCQYFGSGFGCKYD